MKKSISLILALITLNCFWVFPAQAQTTIFTYQGHLTDSNTAANGSYDFQFTLFDALTGGNQIGSTQTISGITVSGGVFKAQLDFGANVFTAAGDRYLQINVKKPADSTYTTLSPLQQITSSPYSIRTLSALAADSLSTACAGCVTNSHISSVDGTKVTGTVANATNAANATSAADSAKLGGVAASNFLQKTGGTMTGALILPANGLTVGTQIRMSGGLVGIGGSPLPTAVLTVIGHMLTSGDYKYDSFRGRSFSTGPEGFISADPVTYQGRIDDGAGGGNGINGLGSLWAIGGTPGNPAYFIAPVQFPDGATIGGFTAQVIKAGGSRQCVIELYRSDSTGFFNNSAELIASATTTTSDPLSVITITALANNPALNTVFNGAFRYFIRFSGEQNTESLRLCGVMVQYGVSKAD